MIIFDFPFSFNTVQLSLWIGQFKSVEMKKWKTNKQDFSIECSILLSQFYGHNLAFYLLYPYLIWMYSKLDACVFQILAIPPLVLFTNSFILLVVI